MTQEEKAKRYDEVLESIKELYSKGSRVVVSKEEFETIFPELKVSEDERIRKGIIYVLEQEWVHLVSAKGVTKKEMIGWLERQSEKPQGKTALEAIHEEKVDNANKIEPKFHEGEWVVCEVTDSVYQIKNCIENLSNHKYGYDLTNGGYIGSDEVNHYHLWTIQDAKSGDVLDANGAPFIYKKHDKDYVYFYCGVNLAGEFIEANGIDTWNSNSKVQPATKEQRDTLFTKMREADYEWNEEKKELRKIVNPSEPDLVGMKELGKVWDEKQDPILQKLDKIYDLLLHKLNEKIIINNPFPRLTETPYKPGEVWCGSSAATSEKGGEE